MRAADVMTPDPVCISPDAAITDAIQLMLERKFSGLPVVDARGALVGIITEGDLVRRTETGTQRKRWGWIEFLMGPGRLAAEYLQTASRKVGDVMTADVHWRYADFQTSKKELNFKKIQIYKEVDHVEFNVVGLAYRYDDGSLDGIRSLFSRLCKCCQVLCAVKRGNSRRTS